MMRSRTALFAALSLPLCACERFDDRPVETVPESLALGEDRRPAAGLGDPGEDITELVREQNAKGREPPVPTRRGTASRTAMRPFVQRTKSGFVAHIPGARSVPTPAHHAGNVIVGGYGTWEIYGVQARTGKAAWSLHLSDDGPTDPACKEGVCVFNTFSCTIFSVEAETGKPLWSWYLGSPQLATPVISGDVVYTSYPEYGGPGGRSFVIGAFGLRTGKPLWRRWIDAEVNSTPVVVGGHVLVATRAGTLYDFAAGDGEVLSARQNQIASAPVLSGGLVLFGRGEVPRENSMVATSSVIFSELEPAPAPARGEVRPRPRPLVAGGRLIHVDRGVVVATERKTGRRLWQHRFGDEQPADVPSPMLQAGPAILLATSAGNVMRIDPDSGDVGEVYHLGAAQLSSQPIAVDGWLYAGTHAGTVVAIDTGDAALTGWEMLGGGPDRRGTLDPEGT